MDLNGIIASIIASGPFGIVLASTVLVLAVLSLGVLGALRTGTYDSAYVGHWLTGKTGIIPALAPVVLVLLSKAVSFIGASDPTLALTQTTLASLGTAAIATYAAAAIPAIKDSLVAIYGGPVTPADQTPSGNAGYVSDALAATNIPVTTIVVNLPNIAPSSVAGIIPDATSADPVPA